MSLACAREPCRIPRATHAPGPVLLGFSDPVSRALRGSRLRALLNPAPVAAVPRPPRRHCPAPATRSPGERPREPGLEPDSKHPALPATATDARDLSPLSQSPHFHCGQGSLAGSSLRLISLRSQKPGRFYSACGRTESSLRGSWLLPRGDGCRTAPHQNRLGSLAAQPRHLGPPQTRGVRVTKGWGWQAAFCALLRVCLSAGSGSRCSLLETSAPFYVAEEQPTVI